LGGKNPDPADPWLIAVAAAHGYVVVTDENQDSPRKIPAACRLPKIWMPVYFWSTFFVRGRYCQRNQTRAHIAPLVLWNRVIITMPAKKTKLTDAERAKRIRETAREIGTDNDPESMERAFKKVVARHKPKLNEPGH
jgi:Domain of unknown function (DUF4411)